jgi:hypothetical protein
MHDPRTHLYRDIHKAVRLLLCELSQTVGCTDWSDAPSLEALRARVRRDFSLLGSHAHHEDAYILPLLEAHCPEVARRLSRDHAKQHDTMPALERQLAAIDPSSPAALAHGDAFRVRLSRYIAEQLEHMADEEEFAMAGLYAALDDPQLVAVHDALVASVPPEELMSWLAYMIPAMAAPDRAGMLAGMRAGAPAEVFEAVIDLSRQVLSEAAFEDLRRRLGMSIERAA